MEPTDLNNSSPDDAQLEAWYRANVSAAPLADDGFSRRVVAALPPAQRADAKRRRFCLGGALIGVGVALGGLLSQHDLWFDLTALEPDFTHALTQLADPAVGLAFGITVISMWFVFRPKLRLLPRL